MENKQSVMTCVLIGCDVFPREAIVDGVAYKAKSASVYDEIERNRLLENIITKAQEDGLIDDNWMLSVGVTQDEINCICYDTSILDER